MMRTDNGFFSPESRQLHTRFNVLYWIVLTAIRMAGKRWYIMRDAPDWFVDTVIDDIGAGEDNPHPYEPDFQLQMYRSAKAERNARNARQK
jgi:hypothetical protein